jgi:hypothetical protein
MHSHSLITCHKKHFIDHGSRDHNGLYEYYYEGDMYYLSLDGYQLEARSYKDTPEEIALLAIHTHENPSGIIPIIPYNEKYFITIIQYIREELGFKTARILLHDTGYQDINLHFK